MPATDFDDRTRANAQTLIELAIAEDLGTGLPEIHFDVLAGRIKFEVGEPRSSMADITSASTIPGNAKGKARFVSRSDGIIAGLPILGMLASRFGVQWLPFFVADGARVQPGTLIASISGPMRDLLMVERTALNFLQHLSGIATLTAQYVDAVSGTSARILDTRKTTPGWRFLEKYAVRCGGGTNHRFGLFDAILIKDNHLAWLDSVGKIEPISAAIQAARAKAPAGMIVEIEVDSLEQFDIALAHEPDIILVDNLGPEVLAEAVRRRDSCARGVLLEASGGVKLAVVRALATTGVDRISIGALTHSAPSLDIGLDFDQSILS